MDQVDINAAGGWKSFFSTKSRTSANSVLALKINYTNNSTAKVSFSGDTSLFNQTWAHGKKKSVINGQPKILKDTDANNNPLNYCASINVSGNATVTTGAGNDIVYAVNQRAVLTLDLGSGNDLGVGASQNDTLSGAAGNDCLAGMGGNDVLNGGSGNDTLIGGAGDDVLTGGTGNDVFRFSQGDGNNLIGERDIITDFTYQPGTLSLDKIDLKGLKLLQDAVSFDIIEDKQSKFASIAVDYNGQPGTDLTIVLSGITYQSLNASQLSQIRAQIIA